MLLLLLLFVERESWPGQRARLKSNHFQRKLARLKRERGCPRGGKKVNGCNCRWNKNGRKEKNEILSFVILIINKALLLKI